ncbi:hypothetical protein DFQ28_000202 [Apophysomyces sp. BC1034]|nr:hypothetical protein DFQ30_000251 [Apophysomyces sp. BC1015]KAG0178345.1 hypothetical protein DFQ29_003603 [Apophysomyces sp. BC1021]KAG0191431.1 hypothetical protein DFQ28_000202 [Apophysomyces sp. BC1034]
MSENTTTSLIVVLKGSTDIETDGRIIRFGNGASLDTVRSLAAEKLGIAGQTENVLLSDGTGRLLDGVDDARQQQVVYVDLREQIKEIIPGPTKLPFVGSLYDMLPDLTQGWVKQFKTYGPLVDVTILGKRTVGTNDPTIAELFVKESEYFTKKIGITLIEVKPFGGQGLFTTDTADDDWQLAHKLLMPAFSPRAIKAYQEEMGNITQQTIKIFEEFKPDEPVEILDWTTNVTFETIGRVGFGYEFHLLEERDRPPHPFIEAMGYCMKQVVTRFQQAQFIKQLPIEANRRFDSSVELMHRTVEEVITDRKNSPHAHDINKDLLGYMLNARDEHNLGLSDSNIRDQVVTFLIAGHDTTANTLAWTLYQLALNPEIEAKLLQEVVNAGITHDKNPTTEQISNLKYMHQVLKETLRLYPPVRMLGKYCKKDCIVPGGYRIKEGTAVAVNVYAMHHNEKIYPEPLRWDPDRWTPEEEQKRSRFSWLPFSTGPRSCIGMAFALQEAKTVLAMFLHRFQFRYDGPVIRFDPKMATTKPLDLFMTIHPRTDLPEPNASGISSKPAAKSSAASPPTASMPELVPSEGSAVELPAITFLFGTQTGTAQDYAAQLALQAKGFGFKKVTTCEMDKWTVMNSGSKQDSANELVVICSATYNGQPPDSAEKFDKFLDKTNEAGNEKILKGVSYAVFGLGNKNWRTYQHFPLKIDRCLEELGAERFYTHGEGDADKDMDAMFNEWCAYFWSHTLDYFGVSVSKNRSVVPAAAVNENKAVKVDFVTPKDAEKWSAAQNNINGQCTAKILVNRELQHAGAERSTRHIELDISGVTPLGNAPYIAGDHLEVMPENDPSVVEAIALSFGWILDSVFEVDPESLEGISPRSLAATIRGPCTVRNALTYYADLSSPPSRSMLANFASQLRKLAPETADEFEKLTMPDQNNNDQYPAFVKRHRNLLVLQKAFPQVNRLDLGQFLAAVGVMQPRRYSIASSPLQHPTQAHLAVGVVDDVIDGHHYHGLASSFLARTSTGAIRATLKSSKSAFALPADPSVPIIMIAAGTGFSPFRGFLQERAQQRAAGQEIGQTVLFFGCRRPDQDYIYSEELEAYTKDDLLKLHVAFSRVTPPSPIKYVQHQLLAQAADVWKLLMPETGKPANIYVCGSGAMSRDVRRTFAAMAMSFGEAKSDEEAEAFIQKMMDDERYNEDVWG